MRVVLVGLATAALLGLVFVVRAGGIGALTSSGGEGSYRFLATQAGSNGEPITYSSCRSIPVEFNLHGVDDPETTRQVLLEAMGAASAASHLNLVYARDSARRPRANFGTLEGYPVLIAFADPSEIPMDRGIAGEGGSSWVNLNGRSTYISGQVVLERRYWNSELHAWHGHDLTRAIVMHELGHVLGLGHVHESGELMNADNEGKTTWGPGDRAGLAILGKGPCT
ncbi:matrixin family metalloprotease [Marmoricola sp. URHB0036]|uniref:matrixin family metalloprotease n=1 Tax=Marmoricola sp. URHB0036 TaxID=1298863 RepID=UPI000413D01C|nr:matrixin family metalloprotease [Marmoricola sp. URHB0036]